MSRLVTRVALTATCVTALATGVAAPAFAATPAPTPKPSHAPATLSDVQAAGEKAIDKRLSSLSTALTRVAAAKGASSSDQATITGRLKADQSGLTALRAKIAADTDAATAKKDVATIYSAYRVYAVALPQSRIALGADRVDSTALVRLQKEHDRLASRHADSSQLSAMQSDIDAAKKDADGLSTAALAVTPAAYDANHSAMDPLRSRAKDAVASVKKAVAIATSLRGSHAAPKPSASAAPTS